MQLPNQYVTPDRLLHQVRGTRALAPLDAAAQPIRVRPEQRHPRLCGDAPKWFLIGPDARCCVARGAGARIHLSDPGARDRLRFARLQSEASDCLWIAFGEPFGLPLKAFVLTTLLRHQRSA